MIVRRLNCREKIIKILIFTWRQNTTSPELKRGDYGK